MRFTGFSYSLIKRVADDLAFNGQVSKFVYPNLKTPQQLEQLDNSIKQLEGSYSTIADLKRANPTCSRKFIARKLRSTGHRYQMLPKNELRPKRPPYTHKEVLYTVRHLAQCLVNNNVDLYYVDEVHFPITQTATHHWTRADSNGHNLYYNRRITQLEKLSVIALCSTTQFVAIQIFKREITGDDFLFFMQEALLHLPTKAKVSVLADNATWHRSETVTKTRVAKALEFNAPALFQANLIENCFSFVRSMFRKRPVVETYEEEARLLLQIFFDPRNQHRFEGCLRNHLRSLESLLFENYAAIHSKQQRTTRKTKSQV